MAKSICLNEFETPRANLTAPLSRSSFWEHWFETQAQKHPGSRFVDEHRIWEKAVNLEILAMENKND